MAKELTDHAMDCFEEGRQFEGKALRVEAERATLEAEEWEEVELQQEALSEREKLFGLAHQIGRCAS
eukprot:5784010-Prymnesium_polylepis.1